MAAPKQKFEEAPDVQELLPSVVEKVAEVSDNLPVGELPLIKVLFALGENLSYWGKICKTSGPWRYLNDFDYVLLVNRFIWESQSDREHEALLFHELLHIGFKDNAKGEITWGLRHHTVETFPEEVKAYGAWRPGLECLDI